MKPSKYKPEFAEQARKLCELGAIDADLARFFEINLRTVRYWRAQHPEFAEACKIGKAPADDRVERSLYQRACGHSYMAQKVVVAAGVAQVVDYREDCPPDVAACIFWLKNRRGDEWRDQYVHRHARANLSDAELEAIAAGSGSVDPAPSQGKGKMH